MRAMTSTELTTARATQVASLPDTWVRQAQSTAQDAEGEFVETFTDGTAYAGGFNPKASHEIIMPDKTVVKTDGELRIALALDGVLLPVDRIKLTKRYGTTLSTPVVYQIAGELRVGPTGILLDLLRVS